MTATITIIMDDEEDTNPAITVDVDGYTYEAATLHEAAGAVRWLKDLIRAANNAKHDTEQRPAHHP